MELQQAFAITPANVGVDATFHIRNPGLRAPKLSGQSDLGPAVREQIGEDFLPVHISHIVAIAISQSRNIPSQILASALSVYQNCDMENLDTLASRLKLARKLRGISQVELAKRLGTGQSTIASIESGRNHGSGYLVHLAGALDVDSTWLATGNGEMELPSYLRERIQQRLADGTARRVDVQLGDALLKRADELDKRQSGLDKLKAAQSQILVWEKPEDLPEDSNRVWIPRYDATCSAGDGAVNWAMREKQALPFTLDFFRAIGSNPEYCRLINVRGDSMEPYLFDRDMVMVDISKSMVHDGGIYAVCFEDEMFVKQIFKQAGGALTLHSYNPRYPDRIVPAEEGTKFRTVGQIIYRSGSGLPTR